MSINGIFEIEEDDIVTLKPIPNHAVQRSGWVNVGVHAVYIELHEDGDLLIEAHPRQNEFGPCGELCVAHTVAVASGGKDPDE